MTNLRTYASRGIAGLALTVLMGAGLTAAPMAAFAADPAPADDSNVQTTSPSYTGQNNTGPWPGSAATPIESTGLVPTYDGRIGKPNQVMGYTKAGESFAFSVTIPDGFVKERMGSFRVVDPTGQEV